MLGLMQDRQLTVRSILDYASEVHGDRPLASRTSEGGVHIGSYSWLDRRSRRLADSLDRELRLGAGDVIASMAWNTTRHLELWYAAMGIGVAVHTLNPRLFEGQLDYILAHGGATRLFVDPDLLPIALGLRDRGRSLDSIVVLCDRLTLPSDVPSDVLCSEDLIGVGRAEFSWPELDENLACGACYTSGTTGDPKGVVYTHRSNVLHAMASRPADALGLRASDVALPAVPMFHANGWSLAFSAPMSGSAIAMPYSKLDGESLYDLIDSRRVTFSAGVPTVWLGLLGVLSADPSRRVDSLERVVIGGAACPSSMMDDFARYGVDVIHSWGMTEMSPLGTFCVRAADMSDDEWKEKRSAQGRPPYGVRLKIVDDEGNPLPRDGVASGHLAAAGFAVAKAYRGRDDDILDDEGYFRTGDVATLDSRGYMTITDRSKDVIKSGGEWISSIDVENAACGHPSVREAAAIGMPDPSWGERPLLIVVLREEVDVPTLDSMREFLSSRLAKWQLPDRLEVIDALPYTATGKISKLELRSRFLSG